MDYEKLKEVIAKQIKENGRREITGPVLQAVLMAMVDSLGEVYPQTYTDKQKAQARANIDALSNYDGEITKEKLSTEVQAILDDVANKQNITDESLATIAKTIVGAINELFNGGLKDGSIATSKIEDGVVTTDKLADTAVTEDKLASSSVTNAKIANASVSEEKIADNSISTAKVKDGAITEPKLDTDLVNVITSAVQPAELASAIATAVASYVAKADILDTTGSAMDKVMSQHGVTEAINGVTNNVTELEFELKNTINKKLLSPESLVWLNNTTIDSVTGKVVEGSGYSSTQLIQIYNGKFTLYNNGRPTTSLLAGFMAYWGASGNLIGVERNSINQALIAQSSYVQFSIHSVDNTQLALYTIDNGSGEFEKEVEGNISDIFANIYDITKTAINTTNVSWIVGGFDVSKNDFNDASNYVHSSLVLLSGTLRLSWSARFIVYYDISGNIVDYEENVNIPTKAGSYPYCSVVISATAQDGYIIGNNIVSSEQKIENNTKRITKLEKAVPSLLAPTISWTIGENIGSEGQIIADSRYSRTDIIKVNGDAFKLLYFGIPTTSLLAGFMAYYDDQMNLLGCERSTINSALLAQSSYIQFSVNKTDKYDLSQYSIITGEDSIAQFKKEEDLRNIINGYRYLVATFGVAGLKNYPATNALTILGSNDLLHFKTISRHLAYAPTKCVGLRDPSIIKIEDYYYIAYTNAIYLNSTNEIGMCRTKDFVTYEELDNLVLEGENGENFSNGYVWAPAWFKENDNYYLIVGCSETTSEGGQTEEFWHYIFDYDVENHSVSKGFKTNVSFIDGHIYKQNGNYYLLGSSFRLWKSSTLKSTSWVEISPYLMAHIEGQFAIRKDDGTLRIFAHRVPYTEDGVSYPDSHYYYLDGGTDLETGFDLGALAQIKLNPDDVTWAHYAQGNNDHEFWHFTVYDRNCFLDNNENYQD